MGRYDLIFSLNFILVVLYSSIWIPWLNFKWIYFKGDALLSRHTGIDIDQLSLTTHIANTHSGEVTDSFLFFFFLHIHVLIISLIYHIFLLKKACWLTFIWNGIFARFGEDSGRRMTLLPRSCHCENALLETPETSRRNFPGLGLCNFDIFCATELVNKKKIVNIKLLQILT